MTDHEIRESLRRLSVDELDSIWQQAQDPNNLNKRERMAKTMSMEARRVDAEPDSVQMQ